MMVLNFCAIKIDGNNRHVINIDSFDKMSSKQIDTIIWDDERKDLRPWRRSIHKLESLRNYDATYMAEKVRLAEFLESEGWEILITVPD